MTCKIGKPQICWVRWNKKINKFANPFSLACCVLAGVSPFLWAYSRSPQTLTKHKIPSVPSWFLRKGLSLHSQKDPACPHFFPQRASQSSVPSLGRACCLSSARRFHQARGPVLPPGWGTAAAAHPPLPCNPCLLQ